jgi:CHAT domain-containing protein
LTLSNNLRLRNLIKNGNSNELKDKFEYFLENKKQIQKLEEIPVSNRPNNLMLLKIKTEQIEKELIKESAAFAKYENSFSVKFDHAKAKLLKNEVTINVVNFNYYKKRANDSIIYSAFVIKKDSKFPKFIPLFEEKQLALLFGKDKNQQDSIRIDKQYSEKLISELILKPLENELKGISTIYLSLSGATHQINITALPINENQTFGQKYKIHILNSPSELMDYSATTFDKKDKLDFILYGNIDYDKRNIISNEDSVDNQNFVNVDEEIKGLQTRSGISSFGYLSGTKNEIQNISTLAHKGDFKALIFEDRNATEESIKQLDAKTTPFVLHLATHGFFFPDPVIDMSNEFLIEGKSKVFKTSDDPMMRSGLVFSGANKSWGKVNENLSGDDGILTASEISNLDLSACELVVLSACETGLGEIKGSEGVFGLQRAFKMAGVKNIIMSLWKVPDAQTAELFDTFYSECFAGKTIHEAFQSAQAKMKAKYSPYYWAGFVLLE